MKQEEAKWKQRAKIEELLEGESNTRFFSMPNPMADMKTNSYVDQDEGRIEGDKELITYITKFYKGLFGHPESSSISLNIENPRTVPRDVADNLALEFSLEEIKHVVFNMAHNKSPGPVGFTAEFY